MNKIKRKIKNHMLMFGLNTFRFTTYVLLGVMPFVTVFTTVFGIEFTTDEMASVGKSIMISAPILLLTGFYLLRKDFKYYM